MKLFFSVPPNNLNHAVLAIGWGTESGIPYWLIKNSWGKSYGDNGFLKVKRGMVLYVTELF